MPFFDRRFFLAGCLGLIARVFVGGKEKAAPASIERLIRRLGSRRFRDREAASKALEAIGEPSLPALRKAARDDPDLEIRSRAQVLVERMMRRLEPVRIGRILRSDLKPAEKGRKLMGFLKRGMSREQVVTWLGKPRGRIYCGCGMDRSPPTTLELYLDYGLVITYEADVVVETSLFGE
jgi:hypothetical protein